MSEPRISVILPTFNAARYLDEAIASVRAQTLPAAEIIVVDNGSTDATPEIAQRWDVRYETEPVRGIGVGRNRGLAVATGDFFAFIDADDIWMPQKLELQMAAIRSEPGLEAAFGLMEQFISPELTPAEAAPIHCPPGIAAVRLPLVMLITRDAFGRVGRFSTDSTLGDTVEWFARAQAAGLRYTTVPHLLARRRLHANNTGRLMRDERMDYVRILKQKLDRERAARNAPPGP